MKILILLFFVSMVASMPVNGQEFTDTQKQYLSSFNELKNPGFENGQTGWTISKTGTATCTALPDTSPKVKGKKSIKITVTGGASGGTCTFYQDASTVAVGGIAQIYVYSTEASGVKAIKRVNEATALELDVVGKSEWQLMKFPGALGSTSTGVGAVTTVGVSETKTVYLDEGKVGIEDIKQVTDVDTDTITFTPVVSGLGAGGATSLSGKYSRVGDKAVITYIFQKDTTAGTGSSQVLFSLPDGLSGNTGNLPVCTTPFSTTTKRVYACVNSGSPTNVALGENGTTNPITGADITASRIIRFTIIVPIQGWSATTEVYSAEAEFFSTDTNTLSFKSTAIVDSDPVGTFNTYSYDGAPTPSNNKTICGVGQQPTQTTDSMRANGFLIATRAYNADSSCAFPARVEIKVAKAGTSLAWGVDVYKNPAKILSGILDYSLLSSNSVQYGLPVKGYDQSTGILSLDAGLSRVSTITSASIPFNDNTTSLTGYLVINAQPKKTTAVQDFGEFDYVYARYSSDNTSQAVGTSAAKVTYEDVYSDEHSLYSSGIFTAPTDGLYSVKASFITNGITLTNTQYVDLYIYKNGSSFSRSRTIGTGGTTNYHVGHSDTVPLNKGDTIEIYGQSSVATTFTSNSAWNHLIITRIPGQFR